LRYKYGLRFVRPDYDPTRVPIFLGPVSAHEQSLVDCFAAKESSISVNTDEEEKNAVSDSGKQVNDDVKSMPMTQEVDEKADQDVDLIDFSQDLIDYSYISSDSKNQPPTIEMDCCSQQQQFEPAISHQYFSGSADYGRHQISNPFQADRYEQPNFAQYNTIGQSHSHMTARHTVLIPNTIPPSTPPPSKKTDTLCMLDEEVQRMKEQCFSVPKTILTSHQVDGVHNKTIVYSVLTPPIAPPPPIPLVPPPISTVTLLQQDTTLNLNADMSMSPITPNSFDSSRADPSTTASSKKPVLKRWKQSNVSKPHTFIAPSSAPGNEIRYYGTQRVVITKTNHL